MKRIPKGVTFSGHKKQPISPNKPSTAITAGLESGSAMDEEFSFVKPRKEFLSRCPGAKLKEVKAGKKLITGTVATLTESGKVELNRIADKEGLIKFLESKTFKVHKLREADPFATGTDILTSGVSGNQPNDEYTPIMGGPFSKQQYIFDYLDMHSKCFWYKNHQPLAKQIVDLISYFTLGRGCQVNFKNHELQEAWDKFSKRVDFNRFVRMDSDTLTWAGEFMTFVDVKGGLPYLKHIDPSTVWEIVTDPTDIEDVKYYHQQFPTQWQLVYKSSDIASEYIVNDIPAEKIIHMKINSVPGEKRGRSDLLPVLGYLKRMRNYLDAKVIKAQIEASWCLLRKVKGADTDVASLAADSNNNQVPPPGSQIWENEAIDTSFIGAQVTGARGEDGMMTDLKAIIATGVGLSPEFLGAGGTGQARATAITKSEPAARKFEDRQFLFENYIKQIVEWWLVAEKTLPTNQVSEVTLAIIKTALANRDFKQLLRLVGAVITGGGAKIQEPIDKSYEVVFPEIDSGNRKDKIADITSVEALGDLSHETAARMRAKELNITSYDFQEEQERIQEEKLEGTQTRVLDPGEQNPDDETQGPDQDDAGFKQGEKTL